MKQESALRPNSSASCCGSRAKAPPRLRTCASPFPIGFRIQGKKHARHTNAFLRTQASHYCIAFLQRYGSSERRGPMYIPALRGLGRGDSWLPGSERRGRTACLTARLRGGCLAEFRRQGRRNVRPRAAYTNRCRLPTPQAPLSCTKDPVHTKKQVLLHTCFSIYTALMPLSFPFERR